MNSRSIFALPGSVHDVPRAQQPSRKRKRGSVYSQSQPVPDLHESITSEVDTTYSVEYTAVVTPEERIQRRLAGLPLNQSPPSPPFPHASASSKDRIVEADRPVQENGQVHKQQSLVKPSLHTQHLAAMSAILHRCMMAKDYQRAGRALGLILRNEVGGRSIDIRSAGLWGIGAEILLRQIGGNGQDGKTALHNQSGISRDGLERAKTYYERLIVQYPIHKTWPDVTNALDFSTALFGLWVYVTSCESSQMQRESEDHQDQHEPTHTLLEAKIWELGQAQQIAESMDKRMREVQFGSDPELIRLRGMVALWTADLFDQCFELEADEGSIKSSHEDSNYIELSNRVERAMIDPQVRLRPESKTTQAANARKLAHDLLARLEH